MSRISQMLRDDEKYGLIAQQLVPGTVVHLRYRFPRASGPLNKFMVLVCWEPDPLFVTINSCIGPFVAHDADKVACQVDIAESDYDFLSGDSYINCYEIESNIERQAVLAQVASNSDAVKGRLLRDDAEGVINAVNQSKGIDGHTKSLTIGALRLSYPEVSE